MSETLKFLHKFCPKMSKFKSMVVFHARGSTLATIQLTLFKWILLAWSLPTFQVRKTFRGGKKHGRMARGSHGLPKVSPGPAMHNTSTPCWWAIPETALWLFQGWPARRAGVNGCLLPLWTPCAVRLWKKGREFVKVAT
jgi:hypothetical protein